MKKRILCLVLCLVMVLALLPANALADDGTVTISWYLDANDLYPTTGIEHPYGTYFAGPPEPARDGESFIGWYTDPEYQHPFNPQREILSDLNLYARWVREGEELPIDHVLVSIPYGLEIGASIPDFLDYVGTLQCPCSVYRVPTANDQPRMIDMADGIVTYGKFEAGHTYKLCVPLEAKPGYRLSEDAPPAGYLLFGDKAYRGSVREDSYVFTMEYIIDEAHEWETVDVSVWLNATDTMMTAGEAWPKGLPYQATGAPGREDDYFIGWCDDRALTKLHDDTAPVMEDLELIAKWQPKSYVNVRWYLDPNDYDPVTGIEFDRGSTFAGPPEPGRDGYKFGGWFYDRACTEPFVPNAPLTHSIDLFPLWTETEPEIVSQLCFRLSYGSTVWSTLDLLSLDYGKESCAIFRGFDPVLCTRFYDSNTDTVQFEGDFDPDGDYSLFVTLLPFANYRFIEGGDMHAYVLLDEQYYYGEVCPLQVDEQPYTLQFFFDDDHKVDTLNAVAYPNAEDESWGVEWYVPKGAATYAPLEPTKEGYTFGGWYYDKAFTDPFDPKRPVNEDLKLYGQWIDDTGFEDAPAKDDWSYEGIEYCVRRGLMNGVSATRFNPLGTVTRAQLVTILYRAKNSPEVAYEPLFSDVPDGQWYSDAVIWAAQNGIVNGVGEGRFAPDSEITREQIATILYRFENSPKVQGDLSAFPDAEAVSGFAREAMLWANRAGLINGVMSGNVTTLAPKADATRAQIASIIMRYIER